MTLHETPVPTAQSSHVAPDADFHLRLRAVTHDDHRAVDAAFSAFDLSRQDGYRHFLHAHARVLPAAERLLDPMSLLPDWTSRADALACDLAVLGRSLPPDLVLSPCASEAARWGALYVLEGSRLGGQMLSKTVPAGLPHAYLASPHPKGGWRGLLARLDALAARHGAGWQDDAVAGAREMFGAFRHAAALEAAERADA